MKGEISREHTIWCGLCAEWWRYAARTKSEMTRYATRSGWKKTKKHGWICPRCVKELEKK